MSGEGGARRHWARAGARRGACAWWGQPPINVTMQKWARRAASGQAAAPQLLPQAPPDLVPLYLVARLEAETVMTSGTLAAGAGRGQALRHVSALRPSPGLHVSSSKLLRGHHLPPRAIAMPLLLSGPRPLPTPRTPPPRPPGAT